MVQIFVGGANDVNDADDVDGAHDVDDADDVDGADVVDSANGSDCVTGVDYAKWTDGFSNPKCNFSCVLHSDHSETKMYLVCNFAVQMKKCKTNL